MKTFAPIVVALALAASSPALAQDEPLPSVDEVMSRLDDLYRMSSSHSEVTMEIVTEDWARTLEMEQWTLGDDNALVLIHSPAREAGTATLRTDEGLWNYAPRADRLVRVPSGMMGDGWMGSHFTNDDLMRESSYDDDYDTVLSWGELDGARVLVGTSTPHEDAPVVYTRVVFMMDAETWVPLRYEYYDGNELMRTMAFSDVRDVDGRPVPMTMLLQPADAPDEHTRVTYDTLEFDATVDADTFTARGLRRLAQQGR